MPKYAELLYNGFWYSPERLALQAAIDKTQEFVTGTVRLKLYKVPYLHLHLQFASSCLLQEMALAASASGLLLAHRSGLLLAALERLGCPWKPQQTTPGNCSS